MINRLSIEKINGKSPYHVEEVLGRILHFTSDSGVELAINFIDDDLLTTAESYQLVISNVKNMQSPQDKKVRETILAIIEEFFDKNEAALLYICETGDGKQRTRSRLFNYWFDAYEYNSKFSFHTTCINDEEGTPNFAALILRHDNPQIATIVNEFIEAAKILQQKP